MKIVMVSNIIQKFEKEVTQFGGKIIYDCNSELDFEMKAKELGASEGSWGFYNSEDRIGVFFPGLEQAHARDSWQAIGRVPVSPYGQCFADDPCISKFKEKFKPIAFL